MKNSYNIIKAKNLIDSVKNKKFSNRERCLTAIDLAALLLEEARSVQTIAEKHHQAEIGRLMEDPLGKAFITQVTDQCFRSKNTARAADQLGFILKKNGIPKFFIFSKRFKLFIFKYLGKLFPNIFIPLTQYFIRRETANVILPGEDLKLSQHLKQRKKDGVRVNLNHLGEAILGEEEAIKRLNSYVNDLAKPEIEYISVKISSICSQLNLLSRKNTLEILSERLKTLYREAKLHLYVRADGSSIPKFVNLDMEEYRDLHLTIDLFCGILDEPEFLDYSAGIVLQSYLPDSYDIQKKLTAWALERINKGGVPIKIRIVKGANLAMEQVEASLRGWPQAPYAEKVQVDANFKCMVTYGCENLHAKAVHIGIGSHNLFDIAYTLLLRAENKVESSISFEMLEGMADPLRRVVQEVAGDILLYCPAATEQEFQFAVSYLVRRLDENTAPNNFLRHAFSMIPGTKEWQNQAKLFTLSCEEIEKVNTTPRRQQNRFLEPIPLSLSEDFENEPDTDWSLPHNFQWGTSLINEWSQKEIPPIPLIFENKSVITEQEYFGEDPSYPSTARYKYSLANSAQVNKALCQAEKSHLIWKHESIEKRSILLAKVAQQMRCNRKKLIGAMITDGGKTISEADAEVSEAIDFAEYYWRNLKEISSLQDITWQSKGIVVVATPWNFPCSIPAGCIAAALAAGNTVLFKPAPEAVLVGLYVAQCFWEGGIEQDILQFIPCSDEPVGSELIQDKRVAAVMLTGSTNTAKHFLKIRPALNLIAETGGKNALIITNMADRELAIKDLVYSAFGHAGQKCSACSLVICESEVYEDEKFLKSLADAASSLPVGSQWDLASRVNPLIKFPNPLLLKGLTQLEEGETWLLKPKQNPNNPNLWSPGIKLGVKKGSFTHQNELFGPILAIMRAENLDHAIELANSTMFGLTAGLHSLDEREHLYWIDRIEAGNLYINRGMTGAIVQRQPFGGCKQSSFGRGAKAGGPNYLMQLMHAHQTELPEERNNPNLAVQTIQKEVEKSQFYFKQLPLWIASVKSYAFFWNHYFQKDHDPSLLLGQDNFLRYIPHSQMTFRVHSQDEFLDILRVIAASATCQLPLELSGEAEKIESLIKGEWRKANPDISIVIETENQFINRLKQGCIKRLRLLATPIQPILETAAEVACNLNIGPVLANGRVELLHYLRELSISVDYHRYGNLGVREGEKRHPLSSPSECKHKKQVETTCDSICYCK
jgi:RHH-type transcriptional regulator, proline utilization regulon repressor / proline dehydrogenase / delta 1-pyrroline-5-carboxylate dehydrogenase